MKRLKWDISTLSIILLFLLFSVVSEATTLFIDNDQIVSVNDTVEIEISIDEVNNLYGFGFDLFYDQSHLKYLSAFEGTLLNSNNFVETIFIVTDDSIKGEILGGITRSNYSSGGVSTTEDKILMTLFFEVTTYDSSSLVIDRSSLIAPDGITKYPHFTIDNFINSKIITDIYDVDDFLLKDSKIEVGFSYPNPFNATTTIDCRIWNNQMINISVFNTLGQKVESLYSGYLSVGEYQFQWNASGVTSGVYYVAFETDDKIITRKTVLVK